MHESGAPLPESIGLRYGGWIAAGAIIAGVLVFGVTMWLMYHP